MLVDQWLDRIACLAGQQRQVDDLPGGLTNHNYRVRTATRDVVVRISPPTTGLLAVDREHEWLNSKAAHAAGVGAPVVDYLPGEGVLVVGFLPGRTFTSADVGANLPRIARALRRLHAGPDVRVALRHVRRPATLPGHRGASVGLRDPVRLCRAGAGDGARRGCPETLPGADWSRVTTTCSRPTSSTTAGT